MTVGSAGVPVCLSGTSVKRVERESVKRLSTTPLNSLTQGRTWQLAHMHRDTACEKVVNIVHLTPGTKYPASLYDSGLPSDLQGNADWSTCAPNCTNTQPPPNPYVNAVRPTPHSEFRSCVKVEVAVLVLGFPS